MAKISIERKSFMFFLLDTFNCATVLLCLSISFKKSQFDNDDLSVNSSSLCEREYFRVKR